MRLIRRSHILLTGILLAIFTGPSLAIPFTNPDPGFLADDIEDSGLYFHGNAAFSIEFYDFLDIPPLPAPGSEFGFYYGSDPGTLIPIFEADDTTPVPITNNQQAYIDFNLGLVVDLDSGGATPFIPMGDAAIGFYLTVPTIPVPTTLFSQALLNGSGQDVTGTFPFLADPNAIAIAFGTPGTGILSLHSIQPLAPVPIPGAAGLWILGLAGLALFRRRLTRSPN